MNNDIPKERIIPYSSDESSEDLERSVRESYSLIFNELSRYITDSITESSGWYLLVFSPMDAPYDISKQWFDQRGLDTIYKKFDKFDKYIVTKEIDSKKVHFNVLVNSLKDYSLWNGKKYNHKFHCHAQRVIWHRQKVLEYIIKEAKRRPYHLYVDFNYNDQWLPLESDDNYSPESIGS